jgi:hypothetical protein
MAKIAKMAKVQYSCGIIEEMRYLMKKPRLEVREEKKCSVEFHGDDKSTTMRESHTAMLYQNHTARCLYSENGTTKYPRTSCSDIGTGIPHQTNADSLLQSRRLLCLEHHLPKPVTLPELNVPKSSICQPDMCIDIILFTVLD